MAGISIAFEPILAAAEKLGRKTPVASALTAKQWAEVPLALRERAQFSARVESARFLQAVQDKLSDNLAMRREKVKYGEAFVDRSSFIGDMKKLGQELGLNTTAPSNWGTVRDIRSAERLGLIYDMQTQSATAYASWKTGQDADILQAFPAQEFRRVESRIEPRPPEFWPERWQEAGGSIGWVGALQTPMIALKTSPIWENLSAFGVPWPPFDYQSGWGVVDVGRNEAEERGLIDPQEDIQPIEAQFNDSLEASAQGLDPALLAQLTDEFGAFVEIIGNVIRWEK
jgi:hypothetical protein